jgi:tetratricopeptide (TPR) repeat protein
MRRLLAFLLLLASLAPAAAVDPNAPKDLPTPPAQGVDLTGVRAKVKAKDWDGAVKDLVPIVEKASNADAFNLLAFSLRNQGKHDAAFIYYFKALELDPDHKGAREYLGELYVKTGQTDKAREQLAHLQRLCPRGCEELDDLVEAMGGK